MNRAHGGERYAAGKGINVCIALKNIGLDPLCTGFNFKENGAIITNALDTYDVRHDFVTVDGAVRVNIKLYDTATGTMTELNQPGAHVPKKTLAEFCEKIKTAPNRFAKSPHQQILVLSGSMPAGVPAETYERLCRVWPGLVILDADGEALRMALAGDKPPYCIKPNLFELESSFGVKLPCKEDIASFCRDLIRTYGVAMICVSMGADGAVLVTGSAAYYVSAQQLTVRGVQGAGDAMVAGLTYGLVQSMHESELLRMASAAAAASVVQEGTLMCTREGFEKFLGAMASPHIMQHL